GGRADALLNWIYVKPGEMIYNPAGTVHAIGPGSVLLEVQQNSDVTYRLYDYGRPRELHLEQGLAAMKERTNAGKVRVEGERHMPTPGLPVHLDPERSRSVVLIAPHFLVLRATSGGFLTGHTHNLLPQIVVALEGCGKLRAKGAAEVTLARGDVAVIPASVPDFQILPQWNLDAHLIIPGLGDGPEPETSLT
ncbi:MAG: hypothetical protein ACRD24_11080, partial [Terriglobales bacterium]